MDTNSVASALSMPLEQETHTWTGSGVGRFNEDYALIAPEFGCAALVDGATGLTKVNLVAGESDAAWYARHLCKALVSHIGTGTSSTPRAFEEAGAEVAEAYQTFEGAKDLARIDEPNGSVAVLRWDGPQVEVTMLGDCTAVVGLADGSCAVVYDETLSLLDDENYERMYAYATEHRATMAEARRALNPRFIENRLKMNEPGGYWAADISCRGMSHTFAEVFSTDQVAWLFACTDGYANAVNMGVVADFVALARTVANGGGEQLGHDLRAAENEDAGCWRVHRSKTSDDATYLFVRLAREG